MKPGKYYVGDLCYVLNSKDDEIWMEVCDLLWNPESSSESEVHTLKDGREFAILSTAYGDGTYTDQEGREYAVDSGTIGCILADQCTIDKSTYIDYNVIEIIEEFIPYNDYGLLHFGHIKIETSYDEDFQEE